MCIIFQLKPVRSLDSLRPAWSGRLRHGPPPCTVTASECEVSQTPKFASPTVDAYHNGTRDRKFSKSARSTTLPSKSPLTKLKTLSSPSSTTFEDELVSSNLSSRNSAEVENSHADRHFYGGPGFINPTNPFIHNMLDSFKAQESFDKDNNTLEFKSIISENPVVIDNPFAGYKSTPDFTISSQTNNSGNLKNLILQVEDPFDTSQIQIPSDPSRPILVPANPKRPRDTCPFAQLNPEVRSAQDKVNMTSFIFH